MAIKRRYLKLFFTSAANLFKNTNKNKTLPASMHVYNTRPISCGERTILNTSSAKASLTIEAALVLPFFILVFLSLTYFFNIMAFYSTLQHRLEETARNINSFAYILSDSETTPSKSDLLTSESIRHLFMSDDIKQLCRTMHVKNGENGISFYHSKIDKSYNSANLIITYNMSISFLPHVNIHIPFIQRCRFKLFTGDPDTYYAENSSSIIYMTYHGTVYHTNKYCTYLIKYAEILDKNSLSEYEKAVNPSYSLCSACKRSLSSENHYIYISKTGSVYHYSRDCYYLTSHIYECNLADVKNQFQLCSRCSQSSNGGLQYD